MKNSYFERWELLPAQWRVEICASCNTADAKQSGREDV